MKIISLVCCCFFAFSVFAETLNYNIRYAGLNVVSISFKDSCNTLEINAQTSSLVALFNQFEYKFVDKYTASYLPSSRHKLIKQHDYQENRLIKYNHKELIATRTSIIDTQCNKSYPILADTRDFFCALYHLRRIDLTKTYRFSVDANGTILRAKAKIVGTETISIAGHNFKVDIVEVSIEDTSDIRERSDMLTNNIFKDNKKLSIWFTRDKKRLPVLTKYQGWPFSTWWQLDIGKETP